MVKKKQKKQPKEKKAKACKKDKVKEYMIEVSQTRSDVKTFIDKFRSDVDRKKNEYQSYARKLKKKNM